MKTNRNILFVNIFISLGSIVLIFLILEISFRIRDITLQSNSIAILAPEDIWCQYDPVLGWRHIPGKTVPYAYNNIPVVINKQGVRADREYGPGPKRILAMGCSYTFGHGVAGKESWPQRLEDKLRVKGLDYDVINSGVCAYGLDQIYLLFLEQQKIFKPDIVVLGLIDGLDRVVMSRWVTGHGKPRYRLFMDKLVLTNVPTPQRILPGNTYRDWTNILFDFNRSYLIEYFVKRIKVKMFLKNTETERLAIGQKILQEFALNCKNNNSHFLVLLIDSLPAIEPFLIKNQIDFTECSEIFRGQDDLYLPDDGHPTPHGHDLIAEQVYQFLMAHQSEYCLK
jgi:lysophospholipase L1-like esterase